MRCGRCEVELAAGTVGGLCPVCLLDVALEPQEEESAAREFRYELIEEIARGGMGVVYRAAQQGSHRQVAVKMILTDQLNSAGVLERFRAEVEAIASLDHSNILPMYEAGEYEGRPFYSMKFADGGSLRDHAATFRKQPRAAARLIARVARAVHHAHQRGIIHRDLKPGNILLDGPEQTPYVADFGIAKWLGRDSALTLLPAALGTPHYIAPEQGAGASEGLTTAADIYSLGAILYELLAGRPPFVADTALETLRLAAQTTPASPRVYAAELSRDLEVICLKCLAKEPAARYSSAVALAEDLERWLEGRTILARPSSRAERAWRWAKRNPALAGLSAALLIALVAVAIGSTIAATRLRISNERALAAETQAREELRSASVAQARATRLTGRMGQRFDALAALKKAASISPGADLRTEAFAALSLPDVKVERTWTDRFASNSSAAFDPTLERYVIEAEAGVLSLRRTADQSEIARLAMPEGNPRVLYIAPFSAGDQKIAARFANDLVRVYESADGRLLFELSNRPVCTNGRAYAYDFGFTPDGAELAVSLPEGGFSLHDANTGRETRRLLAAAPPAAIAFSPDGSKVALAAKQSAIVEIYNRATGELERRLSHPATLFHLAWRPDGSNQLLTSTADDKLYLWDATSGQRLRDFTGHEGDPPLVAFHPGGKVFASTARDLTVRIWDVETGACLVKGQGLYGEPVLRFSADGRRLAVGSEGKGLSVCHLALDSPRRTIFRCDPSDWYSRTSGVAVSRDGRLVVIGLRSNGFHLFSAETGAALVHLPMWPGEQKTAMFTPASDALIHSGQQSGLWKRALTWSNADTLEIGPPEQLDNRAGYLLTDLQGDPPVAALSGDKIHTFSLVPLARAARPIDLAVQSRPSAIFLSSDARLAATCDWEGDVVGDSDVRIWSAADGKLVRPLGAGANNSVRFSPTGAWLVACGTGAGSGLWRLPALTQTPRVKQVGDDAWFTPDEKVLAVLEADQLHFNRLSDGELIGSFPADPTMAVAFSPDGWKMWLGFPTQIFEWDLAQVRRELRAIDLDWDPAETLPPGVPVFAPARVLVQER